MRLRVSGLGYVAVIWRSGFLLRTYPNGRNHVGVKSKSPACPCLRKLRRRRPDHHHGLVVKAAWSSTITAAFSSKVLPRGKGIAQMPACQRGQLGNWAPARAKNVAEGLSISKASRQSKARSSEFAKLGCRLLRGLPVIDDGLQLVPC